MMKRLYQLMAGALFFALMSSTSFAHCEIPCGIYDDEARVTALFEHIATIEKSMQQISALQSDKNHNANQLIRWVTNKEDHANQFNDIVTQYFMTQRIKLDTADYDTKVGLLHKMLVYSMKCKQTTDLSHTAQLKDLVTAFKGLYFAGK